MSPHQPGIMFSSGNLNLTDRYVTPVMMTSISRIKQEIFNRKRCTGSFEYNNYLIFLACTRSSHHLNTKGGPNTQKFYAEIFTNICIQTLQILKLSLRQVNIMMRKQQESQHICYEVSTSPSLHVVEIMNV